MAKGDRGNCCLNDRRGRYACVVAFVLGMCLASFCPYGLTLFLAAVILTALGFSLLRHG